MKPLILSLVCLLVFCTVVTLGRNPGLKVKVTQNGLNYAATVTVEQLSAKVKGQAIPDQHGSSSLAVGKVEYDVTNIKIRDSGTFDVDVSGVSLTLSISMGVDTTGRPTISTRSCDCNVGRVRVKFHGGASWLYNLFTKSLEKPISNALRSKLRDSLTKIINVDAAKSLKKLKVRVPIEGLLTLDYSLVSAPVFGVKYLESLHKGEFFWTTNQTETPFRPRPVPDLSGTPKMVTIFLSDYVSNSLAYAIYTYGSQFLRYSLTQKDLPLKYRHYLNTDIFPPKALVVIAGNMTKGLIKAEVEHFGFRLNITKVAIQPVPATVLNIIFQIAVNNFIIPKLNGKFINIIVVLKTLINTIISIN
ncbi:hypothetical protein LSH36_216g04027 [Paralvinella palmiformis]|uniref:Lipid-binding serum glycoprotein N-terminal domain-containing protein n=1 Tax=Paralvinella palmiformis TaxID=53620 RepID=A0AAD9N6W2_9ANNE|nr:hypothetical protein LSH36_216g04027 [Paralvinella palmiformis]